MLKKSTFALCLSAALAAPALADEGRSHRTIPELDYSHIVGGSNFGVANDPSPKWHDDASITDPMIVGTNYGPYWCRARRRTTTTRS